MKIAPELTRKVKAVKALLDRQILNTVQQTLFVLLFF